MYNSETTIRECLDSIPHKYDLVIVDQQSSDNSIDAARDIRPDAKIIKAGSNRGFGAGCNLGAANAEGEVLIFLNPDAAFRSSESIDLLSTTAVSRNALVGPRIVDEAGVEQTQARYWSTIKSELGEVVLPKFLELGSFRRDIPGTDVVYRQGGAVPYVQGCCMAVRAADFWKVNGFDERLFLYREEEVLALNLRQIGVTVYLEPQAEICHLGGISTSQARNFSAGQYYRSEALFFSMRHSTLVAFAAILLLWLTLVMMAIATPIRRGIGLRSDKGCHWYLAGARGVISGSCRQLVQPPRQSRSAPTAQPAPGSFKPGTNRSWSRGLL